MAEFRIDRLKFNWKGSWNNATAYKKDDVISYSGKTYVCLQEHMSQINFYNDLLSNNTSQTIVVTVASDNLYSQPHGVFYFGTDEQPKLNLLKGKTYIFVQDDISNKSFNTEIHPLLFSTFENGTKAGGTVYNNGVTYYLDNVSVTQEQYISGFAASNFRKVQVEVPTVVIKELYYFSPNNDNMGNKLSIHYNSNWEQMFDGFEWKADWARTIRYNINDIVKYNGYIYKCIVEHTSTSEESLNIADEIDNWNIFSKGYNWRNTWTTEAYYHVGDVVRYNGIVYIANTSHQSNASADSGLEVDQLKWTILTRSDKWLTDWATETRYIADDLVKYGGRIYRATDGHTSSDSLTGGLEANQANWELAADGVDYKGEWGTTVRYKIGDIVKSSHSLWKATAGHTSTTSLRLDESNWDFYVLGLGFENDWNTNTEYRTGDIVLYGGYTYIALSNNTGTLPSLNGEIQDAGAWELLTRSYSHQGDWSAETEYKTGEVVRASGYLYIAIDDNENVNPDSNITKWQLLVPGDQWRAEWNDGNSYSLGDIVTYRSTAYVCIERHIGSSSDSRPDLDAELDAADYWVVLAQGTPTNILSNLGDVKITDGTDTARLAIDTAGKVLKSNGTQVSWSDYNVVPKVYYVSTDGTDLPTSGTSLSSPFASVAYACAYILADEANLTPATVFIKTGIYSEPLPIRVPKDTALVGDELRSTVIQPIGATSSDMFRVRNGSGIRNMTLQGMTGVLGESNQYLTKRPTGGAYVALDPGTGTSDQSVWITSKSTYVQNVTTFGTGCIGMKIDGSLHGGGNKSIVANDFTQVISDGIGYWATNGGRSELVSVFTYFCHIGYLAEDGGILRATNGNNSYGTYGSVAEGFDATETPINGIINNRDNEALINEVITFGTTDLQVLAVGYTHAGQDYTSADITFSGSGQNAAGTYKEFRQGAISNIRLVDPGDSTLPGGSGYQFVSNTSQGGSNEFITIAAADIGTASKYVGMRIVIQSGKGVGQYAEIAGFDSVSKTVIPSRESDGSLGWDHFNPGWPIETTLDETTRYSIEPKVTAEEPTYTASTYTAGSVTGNTYKHIVSDNDQKILVVPSDLGETHAYSTNAGTTWTNSGSPLRVATTSTGAVWTGQEFIITTNSTYRYTSQSGSPTGWTEGAGAPANYTGVASDGEGNVILALANGNVSYSSDHGSSYSSATAIAGLPAYGNGKFIIINDNGNVAYSTDDGATWTTTASAVSATAWSEVIYGNGRFVAISASGNLVARSFDGIAWFETTIETDQTLNRVSYGSGTFIATGGTTSVALSTGTDVWRTVDDGSTAFTTTGTGTWTGSVYYNNSWILLNSGSNNWNTISTGTSPVIRAKVSNTRISSLLIYDPGSNYSSAPSIIIQDPENTAEAVFTTFLHNGVLAQPEMSNRGEGYVSATAAVTGNGFAEIYQIGKILKIANASDLPTVGANLNINGISDKRYSVSKIEDAVLASGTYSAKLTITPSLDNAESPIHNTTFIIREQYSQIRLTGHDFLDIGTGNTTSTKYPQLYLEGEDADNERQPFNETVASGGGRVFYTSTDQDGNFRVGELFQVEQARGVVTISASQFNLSGLEEISLGGIQVGGSAVVIREFSKEPTFIANSNNIVPTQAAIKSYIESRISGGGANAATNTLIAGQIQITGSTLTTTSGLPIQITPLVNMSGGFTGSLLAQQYMILGVNTQFE